MVLGLDDVPVGHFFVPYQGGVVGNAHSMLPRTFRVPSAFQKGAICATWLGTVRSGRGNL